MKMKIILSLAVSLASLSAMARTDVIPNAIIDMHIVTCPDVSTKPGEMFYEVHKLTNGNTLYLLGCETYAYNTMEKAYIIDTLESVSAVSVPEILLDGSIGSTTDLMGASFDPATETLSTFSKGRGMGDCGSSAIYKYNNTYDSFALVEARIKDSCDGVDSDWPVVYKR